MRLTTFGATRGLVREAFFRIELLLAGSEGEFFAAVSARQNLVCHDKSPFKIQLLECRQTNYSTYM